MATYYAERNDNGPHKKVCVQIGYSMFDDWSWSVDIATGEVYDDTSETGTRLKRKDEVVHPEDLVWRVLMHGKAKTQDEAKSAAHFALHSLCATLNEIASWLA